MHGSLQAFADANYASNTADRWSISVGLAMCDGRYASWFSLTQPCVKLSTTEEAEYMAMTDLVKEVLL